jgi:hypothetical protein
MSLNKVVAQLSKLHDKLPPVELWDPPYCGQMDMVIKANGDWFYQGGKIDRIRLVKLFASVLKKEKDQYYLVTPVEKIKILVENTPFIITNWQWIDNCETPTMQLTTNLDDIIILDEINSLLLKENSELNLMVRRNLPATIHRNVFYQ